MIRVSRVTVCMHGRLCLKKEIRMYVCVLCNMGGNECKNTMAFILQKEEQKGVEEQQGVIIFLAAAEYHKIPPPCVTIHSCSHPGHFNDIPQYFTHFSHSTIFKFQPVSMLLLDISYLYVWTPLIYFITQAAILSRSLINK